MTIPAPVPISDAATAVDVVALARKFAREAIAALVLELRNPTPQGRNRITAAMAVLEFSFSKHPHLNHLAEAQNDAEADAQLKQLVDAGVLDDVLLPLAERRFGRASGGGEDTHRRIPLDDDDLPDLPSRGRRPPLPDESREERRPMAHHAPDSVPIPSEASSRSRPRRRHARLPDSDLNNRDDADPAATAPEPAPAAAPAAPPPPPKPDLVAGPGEFVVDCPNPLNVMLPGMRVWQLRQGRSVVPKEMAAELANHPVVKQLIVSDADSQNNLRRLSLDDDETAA